MSSLRTAKNFTELCELRRDNADSGDFWIIADECNVTLCAQKVGEASTGSVTIPRKHFNRLIDFYNREQPRKPKPRGRKGGK